MDNTDNSFHKYKNGTLTIVGKTFNIIGIDLVQTKGNPSVILTLVTVQEKATLSFSIEDDDREMTPFLTAPSPQATNLDGTKFELLQPSSDPTKNLYASAYIVPVYIANNRSNEVSFVRNVEDTMQLENALKQQNSSSNDFWVVYVLGGFQSTVLNDNDPNNEGAINFGGTVNGNAPDGTLVTAKGSAIYVETAHDFERNHFDSQGNLMPLPVDECVKPTIVHEIGHQFLLADGSGGIMQQSCPTPKFFTQQHLMIIRQQPRPQKQ